MAKRKSRSLSRQTKKKLAIALVIIVVIIAIVMGLLYIFRPSIFYNIVVNVRQEYLEYTKNYYYDTDKDDPAGHNGAVVVNTPTGDLAEITGAEFSIHFLELGNKYTGDCTLISLLQLL